MEILKDLKARMEPDNWNAMVKQAIEGDLEWATDMMAEAIGGIDSTSAFWCKGYHDIMKTFTKDELLEMIEEWIKAIKSGRKDIVIQEGVKGK